MKKIGNSELAMIGAFCRCTIAEKRMRQHFFPPSVFNSGNFMIEPLTSVVKPMAIELLVLTCLND